jgi:starch synthase
MTGLRLLSVASEIFPLIKTGGLADVAGALPAALTAEEIGVRSLIPGYPAVMAALAEAESVQNFPAFFGGSARLLAATAAGLDLLVLDAPHLYDRPGNPYVGPDRRDWPDNAARFAALAEAAARIGRGQVPAFVPDILHLHDWQAALAPALLHYGGGPRPPTVLTVHNLAFQGRFPQNILPAIGLPPAAFAVDGVEFFGDVSYLKAGLQFADRITTVSPTYAAEIRTPEAGMGLDGLLRQRAKVVSGILNGIDDTVWNPTEDQAIVARYGPRTLRLRTRNKAGLQRRLGLDADERALVIGVISRLSWQKGLDLLAAVLPGLIELKVQLALLGAGDKDLEDTFAAAAARHRGRVGVVIGFDEGLAHLIQAGADAVLVPSRFEPCGLTQLCALRYGAIPVVARVGGLADTVIDANEMALAAEVATGVQFAPVTADSLYDALSRTAALFADPPAFRRMQLNGMASDVSWRKPAQRYAKLFHDLAAARTADRPTLHAGLA